MKTTIHIGTTKTGSTSIQDVLAKNRSLLARHGVLYPASLGETTHNVIPVYALGKFSNSELYHKVGVRAPADYDEFTRRFPQALEEEIAAASPRHIVISSEHMQSRLVEEAHFQRLRQLLAPALDGRKVEIVVYLRPQIEHLISLYSTMLRHGMKRDINSFISGYMQTSTRHYFDFHFLIDLWSRKFPEATIAVRAFNDMKGLPHGVVSDFEVMTGLDGLPETLEKLGRRNESMGGWGCEVLRLLNAEYSDLPVPVKQAIKLWIRNDIRGGGHLRPDPELAHAFQDSYADGNAWVITNHLTHSPRALTPAWDNIEAEEPSSAISPRQVLALMCKLNLVEAQHLPPTSTA